MSFRLIDRQSPASARGFTLIELLVVLVIMGLVMGIAIPPLMAAYDRARLNNAAAHLYDGLRRARSTALTRGEPVLLETRTMIKDDTIRLAGPASLTFYPDGSATLAHLTLGLGAQRRSITVDWLTGRPSLAE